MLEVGKVFGELTVVRAGEKFWQPSGQYQAGSVCLCECGNEKNVRDQHLRTGRVTTCGHNRHGMSNTKVYDCWRAMINRCSESHSQAYLYHGRGISVYPNWRDSKVFMQWALENGFSEGLQLDRRDNDGWYTPSNCRFVTPTVNANNKRTTVMVEIGGVTKPFMDYAREYGLERSSGAVRDRIGRGWSAERAFTTPIHKGNYRTRENAPK